MDNKETFEFKNSDLWIETTQSEYIAPDKVKHILNNYGFKRTDWEKGLKDKIINLRKTNAFPLFLESINKKFWFYPTDEIYQRISKLEKRGEKLYQEVCNKSFVLKDDFEVNAQQEEAITSAIYEGANTTRSEAKKFINSNDNTPRSIAHWMILNNFLANNWINENKKLPLSKEIVLTLHEKICKNTLDEEDAPFLGKFRDDKVVVGNEKTHVGVDHGLITKSLDEAIEIITSERRYLHPLLKGIILHYFIAYIHPFFDGNGRTARTLFYFKCLKHDLNWVNFLSISASLKAPGKGYENSFKEVKNNDWDVTYFIIYCLKSLEKALEIVEGKVENLLKIPTIMNPFNLSKDQVLLLQRGYLYKYRSFSIKEHAENIGKTDESARIELKELVAHNFLFEEKRKNKLFFTVNRDEIDEQIKFFK